VECRAKNGGYLSDVATRKPEGRELSWLKLRSRLTPGWSVGTETCCGLERRGHLSDVATRKSEGRDSSWLKLRSRCVRCR
jgi:hypothetical protein